MKSILSLIIFLLTYVSVHGLVKNRNNEEFYRMEFNVRDLADTARSLTE